MKYWKEKGADPKKLMVGLAMYGRGFTLRDTSNNGLDAPIKGGSNLGSFTNEAGFLSYYEVS